MPNIYRYKKISYAIHIFTIADITLYKTGKALAHDAFHHVPTPDFLMSSRASSELIAIYFERPLTIKTNTA